MTTWLTAQQAAAHATQARRALSAGAAQVTVITIYSWAQRGHLTHRGLDARGRRLYTLGDVARAELATRARALRLARH
jgi:DNA-binding transcriptional MerR regulator